MILQGARNFSSRPKRCLIQVESCSQNHKCLRHVRGEIGKRFNACCFLRLFLIMLSWRSSLSFNTWRIGPTVLSVRLSSRGKNVISRSGSTSSSSPSQQPVGNPIQFNKHQESQPYTLAFDLQVPQGRCVGLKLNDHLNPEDSLTIEAVQRRTHWIRQELHPDEIDFGRTLSAQAPSFWMGRLALRHALSLITHDAASGHGRHYNGDIPAILKDPYGRPLVPEGFMGSISHKPNTGVALVSENSDDRSSIGVDVEVIQRRKKSIAMKVLTARERESLGRIQGLSHEEEVLLRFSLKESLYKALHPLICQFVGFQEAEVQLSPDGTAEVKLQLESKAHEIVEDVSVHWQRVGSLFLSTASMRLRPGCHRIMVSEESL